MKFLWFLLCLGFIGMPENPSLSLDVKNIFTSPAPFIAHNQPGPWGSYLVMNLPFKPFEKLRHQLEAQESLKLTQRGEAHITVITPIEYWKVLAPQGVTMKDINGIARRHNIQKMSFEPVCVGMGAALVKDQPEKTFYVVVQSADLIKIRNDIESLFVSKGGRPSDFQAEHFYPHVTLGFTSRDLHESDGVIKDNKTCTYALK